MKSKKPYIACIAVLSLVICLFIFYSLVSTIRQTQVSLLSVTVKEGNAVVVKLQEHPPWAYCHFYGISRNGNEIIISEYYVIFNLSNSVCNLQPVVLDDLPPGRYDLKLNSKDKSSIVGEIVVNENNVYSWRKIEP
jgi:hypothetical protein